MVPGGFESFSFDAELGSFVLPEQVEGDAVEEGEVLRGMACTFATEVFTETRIEHPVEFVFEAPGLTDELIEPRGVGRQAAAVVADFSLGPVRDLVVALALDTHQPL